MRFELTTPTLARLCSTPELRPRPIGYLAPLPARQRPDKAHRFRLGKGRGTISCRHIAPAPRPAYGPAIDPSKSKVAERSTPSRAHAKPVPPTLSEGLGLTLHSPAPSRPGGLYLTFRQYRSGRCTAKSRRCEPHQPSPHIGRDTRRSLELSQTRKRWAPKRHAARADREHLMLGSAGLAAFTAAIFRLTTVHPGEHRPPAQIAEAGTE